MSSVLPDASDNLCGLFYFSQTLKSTYFLEAHCMYKVKKASHYQIRQSCDSGQIYTKYRFDMQYIVNLFCIYVHYTLYSEESDDESDTKEKEERETKDKVEGCVQEGHADCRTERGR